MMYAIRQESTGFHAVFFRMIMLLLLLVSVAFPLEIKFIPILSPVITNPSLNEIDLFGKGFGPPIFIVNLNNAGDTVRYEHMHIRYSVTIEFSDNGTDRTQRLYEGLTDEFTVEPNEVINVSSTTFLNSTNPGGRLTLRYMEYELDDVELKDQLTASKRLPDGVLTFSLELFPTVDPVTDDNSFSFKVLNTTSIDLIAPGNEISTTPSQLLTPRPLFCWTSQLYPGIYTSDDAFELKVFEARPGVSAAEAITQPPILTRRLSASTFQYPADEHQLVPGYSYYWQVTGFIKGAVTSEIHSEVFGFTIVSLTDSTASMAPHSIDEILELLRPIIGDEMVEELSDYMSRDIRIDNRQVSKDDLAEVVRKIITGTYSAGEPTLR